MLTDSDETIRALRRLAPPEDAVARALADLEHHLRTAQLDEAEAFVRRATLRLEEVVAGHGAVTAAATTSNSEEVLRRAVLKLQHAIERAKTKEKARRVRVAKAMFG